MDSTDQSSYLVGKDTLGKAMERSCEVVGSKVGSQQTKELGVYFL
jgi:hypothetical protein